MMSCGGLYGKHFVKAKPSVAPSKAPAKHAPSKVVPKKVATKATAKKASSPAPVPKVAKTHLKTKTAPVATAQPPKASAAALAGICKAKPSSGRKKLSEGELEAIVLGLPPEAQQPLDGCKSYTLKREGKKTQIGVVLYDSYFYVRPIEHLDPALKKAHNLKVNAYKGVQVHWLTIGPAHAWHLAKQIAEW